MNWLVSLTAQRRSIQKSIYILVCASVHTCEDPQESFIIQFHEDAALITVLVNLENRHANSYKIDVRISKAQLISGSMLMSRFFRA